MTFDLEKAKELVRQVDPNNPQANYMAAMMLKEVIAGGLLENKETPPKKRSYKERDADSEKV